MGAPQDGSSGPWSLKVTVPVSPGAEGAPVNVTLSVSGVLTRPPSIDPLSVTLLGKIVPDVSGLIVTAELWSVCVPLANAIRPVCTPALAGSASKPGIRTRSNVNAT